MRTLPALLVLALSLTAPPAHADPTDAVVRDVLMAAGSSAAATCAAVDYAVAVLHESTGVTSPVDRDCAREAVALVQGIEDATGVTASRDSRYVVVLKRGGTGLTATPDGAALAAWRAGAHILFVYRTLVLGYAAQMGDETLDLVRADPNVAYVEADQIYQPDVHQPNPPSWGLDRIDQRQNALDQSYYYNQTGAGVRAYVIDSGINYAHTDFGGRAVNGVDVAPVPNGGLDCRGHGSHVAGTIGGATYGVAKAVTLVSVRVFGCTGGTWTSNLVAAATWIAQNHPGGPAVVNMSLGGPVSNTMDGIVQALHDSGMPVSVAAGNEGVDACTRSPARAPNAMTIGATTTYDTKPAWSNYGPCVDWFAPGDTIRSAWWTAPTAASYLSGTSMAAPHNAGVAALYLEAHPQDSAAQVAQAIRAGNTLGAVFNAGPGSPPDLLHVTTPLHIGAGGTITISRDTGGWSYATTGVFATDFTCAPSGTLVLVTCTADPNPDIAWECLHFAVTATAPMPGGTGASGQVSGSAQCDSVEVLKTPDVNGTGTAVRDNLVTNQAMGTAYTVRCRAWGVNNVALPSGSYQVTCDEPGARHPYG